MTAERLLLGKIKSSRTPRTLDGHVLRFVANWAYMFSAWYIKRLMRAHREKEIKRWISRARPPLYWKWVCIYICACARSVDGQKPVYKHLEGQRWTLQIRKKSLIARVVKRARSQINRSCVGNANWWCCGCREWLSLSALGVACLLLAHHPIASPLLTLAWMNDLIELVQIWLGYAVAVFRLPRASVSLALRARQILIWG
jgi:hypothetical protein